MFPCLLIERSTNKPRRACQKFLISWHMVETLNTTLKLGCIWVDISLAGKKRVRATRDICGIFCRPSIHAWGQHIDHQLPRGTFGQALVGSLSLPWVDLCSNAVAIGGASETAYAILQSPEASGRLVVKHQAHIGGLRRPSGLINKP